MTTCAWAKSVALGCLNSKSAEYMKLSSQMCWTATFHVALLAGCIDQAKYNTLKSNARIESALAGGQRIRNATEMRGVPGGYLIYFVHGVKPIHAMISTDNGMAAGNKNNCVGVGKAVGWEQLNLASNLDWGGAADIRVPGLVSAEKREVSVFCYPITELANR